MSGLLLLVLVRTKFEAVGGVLRACERVARVIGRPVSAVQAESRSDGA